MSGANGDTSESILRRSLDKAGWTKTADDGVAWLTTVAHRTISVQVERFARGWRAWTLIVDGRGTGDPPGGSVPLVWSSFGRVVVGESHAPTFQRAAAEAKRMRARIESQIEALLMDLSTKFGVDTAKDHVINLTGLRGVGPWVGEGPTAALHKADKLRDAYRDTEADAHRLAAEYRRQCPDAKAFRVGPRKASK